LHSGIVSKRLNIGVRSQFIRIAG